MQQFEFTFVVDKPITHDKAWKAISNGKEYIEGEVWWPDLQQPLDHLEVMGLVIPPCPNIMFSRSAIASPGQQPFITSIHVELNWTNVKWTLIIKSSKGGLQCVTK